MSKRVLQFLFLFLGLVFTSNAQERKIEGVVMDASANTLPGATVMIEGTTIGAVTSFDGTFHIDAPANAEKIIVRLIGYKSLTVDIGTQSKFEFVLEEDVEQLEEVVVTALGIEKDKKSLGYSVSEVKGDDLKGSDNNVLNNLNGKVAGVMVNTSSGAPGASSRITIRGNSSLTGNNQPLFIIDGVPVDNSYNSGNTSSGGTDFGSPINDINPDDIESMSVLKGPNAAALYGSRAQNGAIVITTKSGKGSEGLGVSLSNTTTFQKPLLLPNYQNEYGQGLNGQFSFEDGANGGTYDGVDESWGPKLDAGLMIPQFFSNGEAVPWVSNPNNVEDFFETGHVSTTNLSIQNATELSHVRFSMMYSDQKGMVPNTGLENYSASLNFGHKIHENLQFDSKVTYSRRSSDNLPSQGYGENNVMQQFVWFGRQVDTNMLKDYKNPDGTPYNWNYSYHDNPYWILHENTNSQLRDRINGYASLKWNITDYLNFKVKGGTDLYNENRLSKSAMYSINDPDGGFTESNYFVNETNFDFLFSFSKDFGADWNVNANFGGNNMYKVYSSNSMTAFGLASPGVYTPANATGQVESTTYFEEQIINSLYGTASVGYKDFLFADISVRNDWSSTLPKANNSFLYPSVNLSYVFSEHLELPNWISNGKLRGGWAEVGNGATPYSTSNVYVSGLPYNGYPMFKYETTQANPDLKPETTQSWEVGLDMGFFNNRLGFEAAYYEKSTYDQIVPADVSAASGYRYSYINAGQIDNRGVELMVFATPVQTKDVTWDVSFNFSKNKNEVVSLAEGVDSFVLGSYWGLTTEARPGEELGTFYGYAYQRDDQGNVMVDENGYAMKTDEKVKLGSINPDWRGGIRNSITYKNFTLSALIDISVGGDIFSVTNMFGEYAGVLDVTAMNREAGRVTPGVSPDGSTNDKVVPTQDYYQSLYGIHEEYIYDATYIKLAELSIAYNIPSTFTKKYGIKGMSVAFVGNNLFMIHKNAPNIDPQAAFGAGLDGQGFEFGQLPSPQSFGFNIKMNF
ncbi:SusC/RagA family TonB-linked outer membrane protein [Flammeovirga yaeyamensis]|uniref:SusC/RagA family TonB-linked outer membrane protein n=1 Tax=Flammeovirga yaeyamensis TaxID=367791 RepID=A0AAX1N8H2_9BACT|nr:SusC/RagA family TonB-linked outer membrane protein [Flammeovirga yaeyamensis]MBB3698773.1 TonB-linked SusC/RagA family outer membrane protein [Flammeovirga yaeyamensis]NMF37358.1 SusC/RagA family TonB-linked outer membrane protein [Flammeovirga yaeyamensis]QWG03826.1 SusC/RagA family TonB-linked outer membrane protein [Flammeovirga yaeyamensis]